MRSVHYFNPENDLALAAGLKTYTPPSAALQIKKSGELLPLWYASNGDKVLCNDFCPLWLEKVKKDFCIDVDIFDGTLDIQPSPWGWSPAVKNDFLRHGIKQERLPSDERIEKIRSLSHRRTSTVIFNLVMQELPKINFAGRPAIELRLMSDVESHLKTIKKAYLKKPWSSSGRGVISTSKVGLDKALKFASDSIRRQGSVMIEEESEKIIDFANLFVCDNGDCQPIGTSIFVTDKKGAYAGNILASENEKIKLLGRYTSLTELSRLTETLTKIIKDIIAPYYDGNLGIDMLIDKTGRVHPIVELNLRKTMGYVAQEFSRKYLPTDTKGIFTVSPSKKSEQKSEYSASNGLLIDGQILLTPPNQLFSFMARIINDDFQSYPDLLC